MLIFLLRLSYYAVAIVAVAAVVAVVAVVIVVALSIEFISTVVFFYLLL